MFGDFLRFQGIFRRLPRSFKKFRIVFEFFGDIFFETSKEFNPIPIGGLGAESTHWDINVRRIR